MSIVWELYGRRKFNDDLVELLNEIVQRLLIIEEKLNSFESN